LTRMFEGNVSQQRHDARAERLQLLLRVPHWTSPASVDRGRLGESTRGWIVNVIAWVGASREAARPVPPAARVLSS
jgi:hypothetical protein